MGSRVFARVLLSSLACAHVLVFAQVTEPTPREQEVDEFLDNYVDVLMSDDPKYSGVHTVLSSESVIEALRKVSGGHYLTKPQRDLSLGLDMFQKYLERAEIGKRYRGEFFKHAFDEYLSSSDPGAQAYRNIVSYLELEQRPQKTKRQERPVSPQKAEQMAKDQFRTQYRKAPDPNDQMSYRSYKTILWRMENQTEDIKVGGGLSGESFEARKKRILRYLQNEAAKFELEQLKLWVQYPLFFKDDGTPKEAYNLHLSLKDPKVHEDISSIDLIPLDRNSIARLMPYDGDRSSVGYDESTFYYLDPQGNKKIAHVSYDLTKKKPLILFKFEYGFMSEWLVPSMRRWMSKKLNGDTSKIQIDSPEYQDVLRAGFLRTAKQSVDFLLTKIGAATSSGEIDSAIKDSFKANSYRPLRGDNFVNWFSLSVEGGVRENTQTFRMGFSHSGDETWNKGSKQFFEDLRWWGHAQGPDYWNKREAALKHARKPDIKSAQVRINKLPRRQAFWKNFPRRAFATASAMAILTGAAALPDGPMSKTMSDLGQSLKRIVPVSINPPFSLSPTLNGGSVEDHGNADIAHLEKIKIFDVSKTGETSAHSGFYVMRSEDDFFSAIHKKMWEPEQSRLSVDRDSGKISFNSINAIPVVEDFISIPTHHNGVLTELKITDSDGMLLGNGDYDVIELTGQGGYGVFFSTKHPKINLQFSFQKRMDNMEAPRDFVKHESKTVSAQDLNHPVKLMREAGLKKVSAALEAFAKQKAQSQQPIVASEIAQVIKENSYYDKNPTLVRFKINQLFSDNPFSHFSSFVDSDGDLCAQCDTGAQLLENIYETINADKPFEERVYVQTVSGINLSPTDKQVTAGNFHAVLEERDGWGNHIKFVDSTPGIPLESAPEKQKILHFRADPARKEETEIALENENNSSRKTIKSPQQHKQDAKVYEAWKERTITALEKHNEQLLKIVKDDAFLNKKIFADATRPAARAIMLNALLADYLKGKISQEQLAKTLLIDLSGVDDAQGVFDVLIREKEELNRSLKSFSERAVYDESVSRRYPELRNTQLIRSISFDGLEILNTIKNELDALGGKPPASSEAPCSTLWESVPDTFGT